MHFGILVGMHLQDLEFDETGPFQMEDENTIGTYTGKTYTRTVILDVHAISPESKNAEITFTGYDSKTVEISGKKYVMPDVSSTSTGINSVSVGGNTVYCLLVDGSVYYSGTNGIYVLPAFAGGKIKITDYSSDNTPIEYSDSTISTLNQKPSTLDIGNMSISIVGESSEGTREWICNSNSNNKLAYKSKNINCSSTASSNNFNSGAVTTIQFSYQDNLGETYYYYVKYNMPQLQEKGGCFATGTLITLADGTQKPIEEVSASDKILAWDFFTGTLVEKDVAILVNHGDDLYQVKTLRFSDGTELRLIADHGVFDYDLNRFVYIDESNSADYLGHHFAKPGMGGEVELVTLESMTVTEEFTGAWSISTAGTADALAEGLLTVAPPEDFYNWIAMGEKMRYDGEQFARDVETYGLYTYEAFADYVTEEQFEQWNGAYLKIPVEKGYFTFEYILELIEMYKQYMP